MINDDHRRNNKSDRKGLDDKVEEKESLLNDAEATKNDSNECKTNLQQQQQGLQPPPKPNPDNQSSSFRNRGNQRWLKLRTTVQLSNAISTTTHHHHHKKPTLKREDSFLKRFSTRQVVETQESYDVDENGLAGGFSALIRGRSSNGRTSFCGSIIGAVINPDETFYFVWLTVITCCVLYNYWTVIVRQAFPELQMRWQVMWFILDGFADTVFVVDIVVQFRTGYLEQGLMVYDYKKLALHYMKSRPFVMDLVSLTPVEILQAFIGIKPVLRFPRFIKLYRSYHFYYMVESRTLYPNLLRVLNLVHVLLLLAHWFGCFYYMLSEAEQFKGEWVYPYPEGDFATLTRKYLGSVYWATLTLTTIGDLPSPATNVQYVFTIISYLIGVFIFATIVGQVGNVITNRNASRLEFERLLDSAKLYMRHHRVPRDMQRRVQRWYDYSWSRGRMRGGGDINSALGNLPDKLKTELALHVNLKTLKKVSIFKECQPEFLHDLVLKMKAYIFTPGDLICRKGEVAREMFIIADGILEVISDVGKVLTEMKAGDFFGEIGILNLDGFNKRTADVRSVGYSELFSLSREDVLAAMKDFPEAQQILLTMGKKRLQEAKLAGNIGSKPDDDDDSSGGIGVGIGGISGKSATKIVESQLSSRYRHRSVMKKLKQDVSGIKYYFSKSRDSLNQPPSDVRFEMNPFPGNDDSNAGDQGKDSVRSILRKLTKQSTGRPRDFRCSNRKYGSGTQESSVADVRTRERGDSTNRPTSHNWPSGSVENLPYSSVDTGNDNSENQVKNDEVIGAGLPLFQRLLLLNKRNNQLEKEEGKRNEKEKGLVFETQDEPIQAIPLIQRLKIMRKEDEASAQKLLAESASTSTEGKEKSNDNNESGEVVGAGLPLIQRLKLLKRKEEGKTKDSDVKIKNVAETEKNGIKIETKNLSSEETKISATPFIQRLKLLKMKDEEKKKEDSIKLKNNCDAENSAPRIDTSNIASGESNMSSTPFMQRLRAIKKKSAEAELCKSSDSESLDEKEISPDRITGNTLVPEISCSSLRRLSTLVELGVGQSSTIEDNSESSSNSIKYSSANIICDKPKDKDVSENPLLTNNYGSNDSCGLQITIDQTNCDQNIENSFSSDILGAETPPEVATAAKTYPEVTKGVDETAVQSADCDLELSTDCSAAKSSISHTRGILKPKSSTENSNNEDICSDSKLIQVDTHDAHAERRKRFQKSVAFCCESPESPQTDAHKIIDDVIEQHYDGDGIGRSNDEIFDETKCTEANVCDKCDASTIGHHPLNKPGKMVQVISALHTLIKMQMSTIQEKLLNRIQELETEMKRKDSIIESLIMKMEDNESNTYVIEERQPCEDLTDSEENEESFMDECEFNEQDVNEIMDENDTNGNGLNSSCHKWNDPKVYDEESLMRLEFPTMSESKSMTAMPENKEFSIDDQHRSIDKVVNNKKRNPLFRYQSLSMYPESAFTMIDERSSIGSSVPELCSSRRNLWEPDQTQHQQCAIRIPDSEIP